MTMLGFEEGVITPMMFDGKTVEEMKQAAYEVAWEAYDDKLVDIRAQFAPFERNVVLRTIDRNWVEHIDTMSKLRDGIGWRGYAQANPLQQYVSEGYELFDQMMASISREIVFFALKIRIEKKVV